MKRILAVFALLALTGCGPSAEQLARLKQVAEPVLDRHDRLVKESGMSAADKAEAFWQSATTRRLAAEIGD